MNSFNFLDRFTTIDDLLSALLASQGVAIEDVFAVVRQDPRHYPSPDARHVIFDNESDTDQVNTTKTQMITESFSSEVFVLGALYYEAGTAATTVTHTIKADSTPVLPARMIDQKDWASITQPKIIFPGIVVEKSFN